MKICLVPLALLAACSAEPVQQDGEPRIQQSQVAELDDHLGVYPEREQETRILALLREEHADSVRLAKEPIHATITFMDLNEDGSREALAYVEGWGPGGTCGTSGCNLTIYTPQGSSYRRIGDFIGHLPVRALRSRSRGWRDLTMWVQGGGVIQGYEASISFDGAKYEGFNLANPPAKRVSPEARGDTLIPNRFALGERRLGDGPPQPPFGPQRQ